MRRGLFSVFALLLGAALAGQTGDLVPNENLIVEGIPKLPLHTRRDRPPVHGSALGDLRELAPDAPGNAHHDALRRHASGSPRGDAGRRSPAAHVLPGPRGRGVLPADARRLLSLQQGHGRRRVLPDLPVRPRDGRADALDRRQVAQQPRHLVPQRRPDCLRVHAPQRSGHGSLRPGPVRPGDRPPPGGASGGRMAGSRLVAGRAAPHRGGGNLRQRVVFVARRRGDRGEDAL